MLFQKLIKDTSFFCVPLNQILQHHCIFIQDLIFNELLYTQIFRMNDTYQLHIRYHVRNYFVRKSEVSMLQPNIAHEAYTNNRSYYCLE